MTQLPDHVIEAMAAQFAKRSSQIALELCKAVGRGSPTHPRLSSDIKNAAFCALHSETFRALVVAIEADDLLGRLTPGIEARHPDTAEGATQVQPSAQNDESVSNGASVTSTTTGA